MYKTTITLTVLSEDPIIDPTDIAEEAGTGSYSMDSSAESVKVDGPKMAKLLLGQGSDPEFFGLDEDGNRI